MNLTHTDRLSALTVPELRKLAAQFDIAGRSKMRKAELVSALASHDQIDLHFGIEDIAPEQQTRFAEATASTPAPSEGQTIRERLAELPTRELREIAASLAISHRSGMVREQLIAALAGHPTTPAILPAPADSHGAPAHSCEGCGHPDHFDSAPADLVAEPAPREQGFGVTTVSINGGESRWPERFDTIAAAKREVRYMTRGVTSTWRVWITGPGGARVVMGTRGGYNATGKGWIWRSVR